MVMDYSLTQRAHTEKVKKSGRLLPLWRLRIPPREVIICKGYSEVKVATREHVARCDKSGTKLARA